MQESIECKEFHAASRRRAPSYFIFYFPPISSLPLSPSTFFNFASFIILFLLPLFAPSPERNNDKNDMRLGKAECKGFINIKRSRENVLLRDCLKHGIRSRKLCVRALCI